MNSEVHRDVLYAHLAPLLSIRDLCRLSQTSWWHNAIWRDDRAWRRVVQRVLARYPMLNLASPFAASFCDQFAFTMQQGTFLSLVKQVTKNPLLVEMRDVVLAVISCTITARVPSATTWSEGRCSPSFWGELCNIYLDYNDKAVYLFLQKKRKRRLPDFYLLTRPLGYNAPVCRGIRSVSKVLAVWRHWLLELPGEVPVIWPPFPVEEIQKRI